MVGVDMNKRQLEVFLVIAKTQNIKHTAKLLYISSPAVSKTLSELEQEVGVALFDRVNGRLHLNIEGRLFAEKTRELLSDFNDLSNLFNPKEIQPIRIGASITFGESMLLPIIDKFKKEYPKTPIPITIGNVGIIKNKILDRELDLAIIEGNVNHKDLISNEISTFSIFPVGTKQYFSQKRISLKELSGYPLLVREKGSSLRKGIEDALKTAGYSFNPYWESRSTNSLILACEYGLGVTFLPETYLPIKENLVVGMIEDYQIKSRNHLIYFESKSHRDEFQYLISLIKGYPQANI